MGKSDKSLVTKTVIGCLLVMIAVQWAFMACSNANYLHPVYLIVDAILTGLFYFAAKAAYKNVDTAKDNATRLALILITVAIIALAGFWSVGFNERVAPGSPQMEGVK